MNRNKEINAQLYNNSSCGMEQNLNFATGFKRLQLLCHSWDAWLNIHDEHDGSACLE